MLDEEGENGVGKTFLMFGVWRMVNWTLYSLKWWKLFYVEEKNKKHIYLSLLFWKNRNFIPLFWNTIYNNTSVILSSPTWVGLVGKKLTYITLEREFNSHRQR
jgi:hypothetical protein